ncbi:polysaccharide export protein [Spirulina sp. CS-785/01]|uniref:polysaccharide biosynthesis/export family protein n=1 Tax=Spirulina sp. CS-785/01 TaxID=3021716 RepID=UPI00232DE153|nr:polysaccharide biosynthesis/export family protein [Spirulina sp. CS-785/01]MDB9313061.1 polysaccharide export protein [Spirulina sp. CS-785/01]
MSLLPLNRPRLKTRPLGMMVLSLSLALYSNAGFLVSLSYSQIPPTPDIPPMEDNPGDWDWEDRDWEDRDWEDRDWEDRDWEDRVEEVDEFFPKPEDEELIFTPTDPIPPLGDTPDSFEDTPSNQFKPYRLGIGDGLIIRVPRFPEFETSTRVNLEGDITVPLVGQLNVQGLTLAEVKEKVRFELTSRFLRTDPQLIVSLQGQRSTLITLAGEIVRPGYYGLPPGADAVDAILAGGGTTQQADLRSVLVRRTLVDGTVIEQELDLLGPLQQGEALPDLPLQGGDAVIVTQREIGEEGDYDTFLAAQSNVSRELITVRVLNYAGGGLGALQLQNGSSFLDAMTQIAPNTDEANLRNIALIRFDPEQGRPVTQQIDGKSALMGNMSQDVPLKHNDVIVVGRSLIAKVSYALNIFTRPFRDVLGFLLFFQQLQQGAESLFGPGGTTE